MHGVNRWGFEFGRFNKNLDETVLDEIHEEMNYVKMYDDATIGRLTHFTVTWGVELNYTYTTRRILNNKPAFIDKYRRGDGTLIRMMFLLWAMAKEYGVEHKVPCLAMVCEEMCLLENHTIDKGLIHKGPWESIDLEKAGKTLKAIRALGGLTTEDIADYIGTTRSAACVIEAGKIKNNGIVKYAMCVGAPFLYRYTRLIEDDMDDLRRYVYRVLYPIEWLKIGR